MRLRSAAPVAALALPLLLLVIAGLAGLLPCEAGDGCARSLTRVLYLLVIAAPTLPIVSIGLAFLPQLAQLVIGVAASLPLWSLVGTAVAKRVVADTSKPVSWSGFWRRYLVVCAIWVVVALVLIAVYARIAG